MLHSIATGNMLPGWVKTVCVDINPAVATKLTDRGTGQALQSVIERVTQASLHGRCACLAIVAPSDVGRSLRFQALDAAAEDVRKHIAIAQGVQ